MKIPKKWNEITYQQFQKSLASFEDVGYKKMNYKIIDTNYQKIGIRFPILKEIAKKISAGDFCAFLGVVDNIYYEEIMLEGLVIASMKEFNTFLFYFENYIKKLDSFILCDGVISNMKIIKNHKKLFFKKIKRYIKSKEENVIRVGLVILLEFYIEEEHIDKILKLCDRVKKDTYGVNIALANLVSECFIREKKKTTEFLRYNKLNNFTQNKIISILRDSKQVSIADKMFLLNFRR